MEPELIGIFAVGVAILGFLWNLQRDMAGIHRDISGIHREMAGLRECMARIEGLFEGFTGRQPEGSSKA